MGSVMWSGVFENVCLLEAWRFSGQRLPCGSQPSLPRPVQKEDVGMKGTGPAHYPIALLSSPPEYHSRDSF